MTPAVRRVWTTPVAVAVVVTCLWGAPGASAAMTFGATSLAATPAVGSACPAAQAVCTSLLAATAAQSPSDGVIVAWRIRAASAAALALQVARDGVSGWKALRRGDVEQVQGTGAAETFTTRLAVAKGDAIGLTGGAVPDALDATVAGPVDVLSGDFLPADAARPADTALTQGLLLQAVLEPDADKDGYGDETQDACPAEPAVHVTPCHVALRVTLASAPQYAVIDQTVAHVYRVTNSGPSAAAGVVADVGTVGRLSSLGSSAGSCTGSTCRLGTLKAGDSVEVTAGVALGTTGALTSAIAVSSDSTDADGSDDGTSAGTTVTPPSVAPPVTVFPRPACANVRQGTHDDELMDGTEFGDRLIGREGRDLIRGDGGDDCLEGGDGNDVVSGGDGNDRLSGGRGNDSLYGDGGDDQVKGGLGNDLLYGGNGNDTLTPERGRDRVYGGPGSDTISSRDDARDVIDCGAGRDVVRADRRDVVKGCESISRR